MNKKTLKIILVSLVCVMLLTVSAYSLNQYFNKLNVELSQKDSQITTLNNDIKTLNDKNLVLQACQSEVNYCIEDNNGLLTKLYVGDVYKHIEIIKDSKGNFINYKENYLSLDPKTMSFVMDIDTSEQAGIVIKGSYTESAGTISLSYDKEAEDFNKTLKFKVMEVNNGFTPPLKYIGDTITPSGPKNGDYYGFVIHKDY